MDALRRAFRFRTKSILWAMVVVAIALGWWQAHRKERLAEAQLAAMRHARQLERAAPVRYPIQGEAIVRPVPPPGRVETPEGFVKALREIDDWYEFADDTADPFARSPVADEAIPLLIDLLADPDPEVRTRAIATLGKIHRQGDRVVPALIPMLEDDAANVRWHAAFALRYFGTDAIPAIPALLAQLNDDTSPIAPFAAETLFEIDPSVETEGRLIELLASDNDKHRLQSVNVLRDIGSERSLKALAERYRTEEDATIRERLAAAIADIDARASDTPAGTSPPTTFP